MILSEIIKDINSEELNVYFGSNILIDGTIVKNTINRLYGLWECLCTSAIPSVLCLWAAPCGLSLTRRASPEKSWLILQTPPPRPSAFLCPSPAGLRI